MQQPSRAQLSDAVKELNRATGPTVLVVEPNPDQQWRIARLVTVLGHRVIGTSSLEGATALLQVCPVHMVLVAEEACLADPRGAVADLKAIQPACRVTMVTPSADQSGIRTAQLEFVDRVQRPVGTDDLRRLLKRLV